MVHLGQSTQIMQGRRVAAFHANRVPLDFQSGSLLTQQASQTGIHLADVFAAAMHVREATQAAIEWSMLGSDPYGRRPDRFCERSLRSELTGTATLSAFELITSAAIITIAIVQ
jgi:hypothetical protein